MPDVFWIVCYKLFPTKVFQDLWPNQLRQWLEEGCCKSVLGAWFAVLPQGILCTNTPLTTFLFFSISLFLSFCRLFLLKMHISRRCMCSSEKFVQTVFRIYFLHWLLNDRLSNQKLHMLFLNFLWAGQCCNFKITVRMRLLAPPPPTPPSPPPTPNAFPSLLWISDCTHDIVTCLMTCFSHHLMGK